MNSLLGRGSGEGRNPLYILGMAVVVTPSSSLIGYVLQRITVEYNILKHGTTDDNPTEFIYLSF